MQTKDSDDSPRDGHSPYSDPGFGSPKRKRSSTTTRGRKIMHLKQGESSLYNFSLSAALNGGVDTGADTNDNLSNSILKTPLQKENINSSSLSSPGVNDATVGSTDHSSIGDTTVGGSNGFNNSPAFLQALAPPTASAFTVQKNHKALSSNGTSTHKRGDRATRYHRSTRNAAAQASNKGPSGRGGKVPAATAARPGGSVFSDVGGPGNDVEQGGSFASNSYVMETTTEITAESSAYADGSESSPNASSILTFSPFAAGETENKRLLNLNSSLDSTDNMSDSGLHDSVDMDGANTSITSSVNNSMLKGLPSLAISVDSHDDAADSRGLPSNDSISRVDDNNVVSGLDNSALSSISPVVTSSPSSFLRDTEADAPADSDRQVKRHTDRHEAFDYGDNGSNDHIQRLAAQSVGSPAIDRSSGDTEASCFSAPARVRSSHGDPISMNRDRTDSFSSRPGSVPRRSSLDIDDDGSDIEREDDDREVAVATNLSNSSVDAPPLRSRLRFTPLGAPADTSSPTPLAAAESQPCPAGTHGDNSGMAEPLSSLRVAPPRTRTHGGSSMLVYSSDEDGEEMKTRCSPILPHGSSSFQEALRGAATGSDADERLDEDLSMHSSFGRRRGSALWDTSSRRSSASLGHSSYHDLESPIGEASPGHFLYDTSATSLYGVTRDSPVFDRMEGISEVVNADSSDVASGLSRKVLRRRSNPVTSSTHSAFDTRTNGVVRRQSWSLTSGSVGSSGSGPGFGSPTEFGGATLGPRGPQRNDGSNAPNALGVSSSSSIGGAGSFDSSAQRPLPDQSAFDRSTGAAKFDQSSASPVCPATPMRTPTWNHDSESNGSDPGLLGGPDEKYAMGMPSLIRQNSLKASKILVSAADGEDDADTSVDFSRDFVNEGLIGSGTFADVYRVRQRTTGEIFAVKKSKRQFRSKKDREWLLSEVNSMKRAGGKFCEYLLQLVRAWQENGYFHVQVELAERGTIKDALLDQALQGNAMTNNTIWHILHDVCSGLHHIHQCKMVHLDIKPANLLITHSGIVKIGDFGMTATVGRGQDGREGDTRYMAPELLASSDRQTSADVFSMGITLYELCLPVKSSDARNDENLLSHSPAALIQGGSYLPSEGALWHKLREGGADPLPGRPIALQDAIKSAMSPQPVDRATAIDLASLADAVATRTDVDPTLSSSRPRIKNNLKPNYMQRSNSVPGSAVDLTALAGPSVDTAAEMAGADSVPSEVDANELPLSQSGENMTDYVDAAGSMTHHDTVPSPFETSGSKRVFIPPIVLGGGSQQQQLLQQRVSTPTGAGDWHRTCTWRVQPQPWPESIANSSNGSGGLDSNEQAANVAVDPDNDDS